MEKKIPQALTLGWQQVADLYYDWHTNWTKETDRFVELNGVKYTMILGVGDRKVTEAKDEALAYSEVLTVRDYEVEVELYDDNNIVGTYECNRVIVQTGDSLNDLAFLEEDDEFTFELTDH